MTAKIIQIHPNFQSFIDNKIAFFNRSAILITSLATLKTKFFC